VRLAALVIAAVAAAGLAAEPAQGPPPDRAPLAQAVAPVAAPERILVRFAPGADRAETRRAADVTAERSLPVEGLQVVRPAAGQGVGAALGRLNRAKGVLYAEPDHPRRAYAIPDDPLFGQLWGLHNTAQAVGGRSGGTVDADIDAPEAWDVSTGSAGITVAVVDTGVDTAHRDLAPNLWRNPGETAGNGVDDDRNGLVDDVSGWDFAGGDATPEDGNGHGSHVAGTIAARGNDGFGVSGVAWRTSLLPLRVLGADGEGSVSDLVAAYGYAARKGIRIVNASLGGGDFSRAERDAIAAAPRTLIVAAAGNEGANNDVTGSFPCNYDLPNVVCVAATGRDGGLADFSNRGAITVDLAAPGVDIASSYPGGGHALLSGTSMAAPHVAGVAALVWARDPAATVAQVRAALLGSVTPAPSLLGATVTGGVVNAAAALGATPAAASPEAAPGPEPATPIESAPAPAPAVAPGAAAAEDRTGPRLTFTAPARVWSRSAAGRGLRLRVRCSEACALRGELRHGRALAGRGRGGRSDAGTATLVVKLTAAGSRRLRPRLPERVTLTVRAVDPAGNARSVARRITVRR
jgi:subtilisin family serine protease